MVEHLRLRRLSVLFFFPWSLAVCLFIAGCPKVERTAYLTATGAKAFLDSVKSAHPECSGVLAGPGLCGTLARATAAKDLLIDAGEVYCGSRDFGHGGIPCTPPDKKTTAYQIAYDKLSSAVTAYKQAEIDLKGAMK